MRKKRETILTKLKSSKIIKQTSIIKLIQLLEPQVKEVVGFLRI